MNHEAILNYIILDKNEWYVDRKRLEHSLYIGQDNDNSFTKMFDDAGQITFKPFHKVIDLYFLKTFKKNIRRN